VSEINIYHPNMSCKQL